MKNTILILSLILSAAAAANAATLHCKNRGRKNTPSASDLTLSAQLISATELKNITLVSVEDDYSDNGQVITGHGKMAVAHAEEDYKPKKFIGSNQFVLSFKFDKNDPRGTPVDMCQFVLMIPQNIKNLEQGARLTLPMLAHCDQSGGREDLSCVID